MNVKALLAPSVVALLALACGSNPPPAAPPSSPEAPPPSSAEPAPPAATSASAAEAAPAPAPVADDGGGAAPAPNPEAIEAKDECTPVGVDFEKRARPKLKACYAEGKKKNPNLEGTVKIKMTIDLKGKIKSVKVIEKTLPDAVADCMLKVVKTTPFPEVDKCWDATITIPMTFPTPP